MFLAILKMYFWSSNFENVFLKGTILKMIFAILISINTCCSWLLIAKLVADWDGADWPGLWLGLVKTDYPKLG